MGKTDKAVEIDQKKAEVLDQLEDVSDMVAFMDASIRAMLTSGHPEGAVLSGFSLFGGLIRTKLYEIGADIEESGTFTVGA